MADGRHSYVRFFPSDWVAGAALSELSNMEELLYFRICCRIWDSNLPVTKRQISSMVDRIPDGMEVLMGLVEAGKVVVLDDGSVVNEKAIFEANRANSAWVAMSDAGKKARKKGAKAPDGDKPMVDGMVDGMVDAIPHGHNQNQNQSITSNDVIPASGGVRGGSADRKRVAKKRDYGTGGDL